MEIRKITMTIDPLAKLNAQYSLCMSRLHAKYTTIEKGKLQRTLEKVSIIERMQE